MILKNYASAPITNEKIEFNEQSKEASQNRLVEKERMPERGKSFGEVNSSKNRPRARLGFVKSIRNGPRTMQNLKAETAPINSLLKVVMQSPTPFGWVEMGAGHPEGPSYPERSAHTKTRACPVIRIYFANFFQVSIYRPRISLLFSHRHVLIHNAILSILG